MAQPAAGAGGLGCMGSSEPGWLFRGPGVFGAGRVEPGVQGGESACVGKGRGAGQGGCVQGVSVPCCLDFAEEDGVAGVAGGPNN